MTTTRTAHRDEAVFDRARVRLTRNRAAPHLARHAFLIDWTMSVLTDRLSDIRRHFPLVLQIGARPSPALPRSPQIGDTVLMDISERLLTDRAGARVTADEEALPFAPGTFDLVLSPFSLHAVNDLPGTLIQIRRILKPDGLFLAAFPGGQSLHELRACLMEAELSLKNGASPRISPFADKQQTGALMQRAGFALPVVDSETVRVTYENAFRLMDDLRGMGENNSLAQRNPKFPGRALMAETARLYQERHAQADGRIEATFEMLFTIGWAPHESQQKPLRPGSADNRLADALGTKETAAGEKAGP